MSTIRKAAAAILSALGSMLYRDASGNVVEVLIGANGQQLTVVGGVPAWNASGVGDGLSADASEALFTAIGALALPTASERSGFPIVSYTQGVDQGVPFENSVPVDYAGVDLTVRLFWTAPVTAGDVIWDVSFERNEVGHNIDTPAFAAAQSVTTAAPGTSGDIVESAIVFTQAQADGVVAGDLFRLLVTRNGAAVGDDMADVAQLIGWTIR